MHGAYLLLKALHVITIVVFVGGMLVAAMSVSVIPLGGEPRAVAIRSALLERARRWDQRVTTPSMVLAWTLGIALAMTGHWLSQPWLMVKLGLVLMLSALHGVLSGSLRKSRREHAGVDAGYLRYAANAVVILVGAIVVLAVVKPF